MADPSSRQTGALRVHITKQMFDEIILSFKFSNNHWKEISFLVLKHFYLSVIKSFDCEFVIKLIGKCLSDT